MMGSNIENKIQSYNHVFNELQDYMFTNEFIYKFSNPKKDYKKNILSKIKQPNENVKPIQKKEEDFFSPYEKDKLFWCFYVLQNGIDNYEFIKTITFKTEKEYKFKTAEKIKEYKEIFKSFKLKLNELQDEFINQPCI